jgi:DNA-binding FadR family transcriptional regulator
LSEDRGGTHTYSQRSLHGQVAHDIGGRILRGELTPGEILPNEADFSLRLKVSRTALREAIKVLAAKGLVESRPKTGTRVRSRQDWNLLDPDVLAWQMAAGPLDRFVRDLMELRQIIEPQAAAIAARQAKSAEIRAIEDAYRDMEISAEHPDLWATHDVRFHRAILLATGNELLRPLAATIEAALAAGFRLAGLMPPDLKRLSLPLHKAMLDAIKKRNPEAARLATLKLLAESEADLKNLLATTAKLVAAIAPPRRRKWAIKKVRR